MANALNAPDRYLLKSPTVAICSRLFKLRTIIVVTCWLVRETNLDCGLRCRSSL